MPEFIYIEETDSTNNYLKNLLLNQYIEEGTIVYTDFQTAGKGQKGNTWESKRRKNLLFSIVLYPDAINAREQFIVSQIISLAVAESLKKYVGNITIKWPNDIYWREKKICGILIENTLIGDQIRESVCGIGININQDIFFGKAPNPVSLRQITGKYFDLNILLKEVSAQIDNYYNLLKQNKLGIIKELYKMALFRHEGYHLYNDGTNDFLAKIKDVEPMGMLVLETQDGEERSFAFKEVKYK